MANFTDYPSMIADALGALGAAQNTEPSNLMLRDHYVALGQAYATLAQATALKELEGTVRESLRLLTYDVCATLNKGG